MAKATDSTCASLPVSAEACGFSLVSKQLIFNVVCFVVLVFFLIATGGWRGRGGAEGGVHFFLISKTGFVVFAAFDSNLPRGGHTIHRAGNT